jgi:hypothetical protein
MNHSIRNPPSLQELEYRSQELLAQRTRARMLFHCYADADADADDELEDSEDTFLLYYANRAER